MKRTRGSYETPTSFATLLKASPDFKMTTIQDDPTLMEIQQTTSQSLQALHTHLPDERPVKKAKSATDSSLPSPQQEKSGDFAIPPSELPHPPHDQTITTNTVPGPQHSTITPTHDHPSQTGNTTTPMELEIPTATPTAPIIEESTNPISQPQDPVPLLSVPKIADPSGSNMRTDDDYDMSDARSDVTVESTRTTEHKTYSQAVTGQRTDRPPRQPDQRAELWSSQISNELQKRQNKPFDFILWHNDAIIDSFTSEEKFATFINYKLKVLPSTEIIPNAIKLKFKHHDTSFFRSFSRTKANQPAHQTEFMTLFNNALERYKRYHNVLVTNRHNRDQIYDKLKRQLALDHITNLDMIKTKPHDLTRAIYYAIGFARISCALTFEKMRQIIITVIDEQKLPLPESPANIPEDIKSMLPFKLPIEDRTETRSIVAALRKIYTFESLPDAYFEWALVPIPLDYKDLHPSLPKFFPIRYERQLKNLGYYRSQLKQYYIFERIPPNYFDLPPPKPPLPSTPQELDHRIRNMFPFTPNDTEDFKRHVEILRSYYKFKRIPNDFITPKSRLPDDPKKIKTNLAYDFPIADKDLAKHFISEIQNRYIIPIPMPEKYMVVNHSDKPLLPSDPSEVSLVNLTIPIRSQAVLLDTVKLLRQHYYFRRIPDEWIDIPFEETFNTQTKIPSTLDDFLQYVKIHIPESTDLFPIREYDKAKQAIKILEELFNTSSIPTYLNLLPDLPDPEWDLFKKKGKNNISNNNEPNQ